MPPRLTKTEKIEILEETFRLIAEPANWITGSWKCPLYRLDEKGKPLLDENKKPIPVCDLYNRPQAQYCIEGAANQATINILGEERAERMGVIESGDLMADLLGLNKLAMELYDYEQAMDLNDSFGRSERKEGHETILNLVRTQLDRLKNLKRVAVKA